MKYYNIPFCAEILGGYEIEGQVDVQDGRIETITLIDGTKLERGIGTNRCSESATPFARALWDAIWEDVRRYCVDYEALEKTRARRGVHTW